MSESPNLGWVEEVPEDVEASLPGPMRHILLALRQLHREEEGD